MRYPVRHRTPRLCQEERYHAGQTVAHHQAYGLGGLPAGGIEWKGGGRRWSELGEFARDLGNNLYKPRNRFVSGSYFAPAVRRM